MSPHTAGNKGKKQNYGFLIRFLLKTGIMIGAAAVILVWVIGIYRMTGNNMFPSVRDGDLCVFYRFETCSLNDVVLYEDGNGDLRVGRIIAVGGQTIEFMENGGYEVDGYQALEEIPYETYASVMSPVEYPMTLSKDSCFILNDFRQDTADSREYGPVNQSRIKGKLLFLLRRRGF